MGCLELLIVGIVFKKWVRRYCLWRHNAYHYINSDAAITFNGVEYYKFEQLHFKFYSIPGMRKIIYY